MGDRFKDKVVIVTGGSRGLGRAMSVGFAAEGAKVVVASRKLESCLAVVSEIEAAGGRAVAQAAHMGNMDDLDALIDASYQHFGRVDILVNNAGINVALGPLSDIATAAFDKMIDVNLKGPWYLASRLAPRMGEHGGGCVINLLSVAAMITPAYSGIYAATKAGLKALTEVMAQEWAPMNIRVNALAPGVIKTRFSRALWDNELFMAEALKQTPLKRIAEPEEVARMALALASDAGSYMTGQVIVMDGGLLV